MVLAFRFRVLCRVRIWGFKVTGFRGIGFRVHGL